MNLSMIRFVLETIPHYIPHFIILAIGLTLLFWGQKCLQFWLILSGFLVGLIVCNILESQFQIPHWHRIGTILFCGILLPVLFHFIGKSCLCIIASGFGLIFYKYINFFLPKIPTMFQIIVPLVILNLLALFFYKSFIRFASALMGALCLIHLYVIIQTKTVYFPTTASDLLSPIASNFYLSLLLILLTLIGFLTQLLAARK